MAHCPSSNLKLASGFARIPELLAKGVISPDTLLTLVDAIYLKAAWETPFPEKATSDGTFTRLDGSTVTVPFMHLVSGLGYASGAGWRAVELPYVGGTLAMTLILPDDPAAFVAGLDGTTLSEVVSGLTPAQVTLALPRFSAETKVELSEVLQALGMPTAFDGAADFSGITTAADLEISAVVHQANIDVDEKGTVAAAATAVVMRETSIPGELQTVVFDRPFLFALRDVPTGAVLFLGRVGDPTAGR